MEWYVARNGIEWELLLNNTLIGTVKENLTGKFVSTLTVEDGHYSYSETLKEARIKCESMFHSWCKKTGLQIIN